MRADPAVRRPGGAVPRPQGSRPGGPRVSLQPVQGTGTRQRRGDPGLLQVHLRRDVPGIREDRGQRPGRRPAVPVAARPGAGRLRPAVRRLLRRHLEDPAGRGGHRRGQVELHQVPDRPGRRGHQALRAGRAARRYRGRHRALPLGRGSGDKESLMRVPLSILDLAPIARGQTAGDSFANSVALAQRAEDLGYLRVWYAEHHNMASIASSATSVLIAHVGAQTRSIRLGAGGVMLPNHAPLLIAEQFGTLEAMYPGRIDLGLGRAPGSDRNTMYALRRDPSSADTFPQDVVELQGYLTGNSGIPGVDSIPGK